MDFKLLIICICVVFAGIAVCLLVGYLGVYPFDGFYQMIAGYAGGVNIQEAVSNPATIVTGAASAAAVAIPLINKANSYKNKLTETTQQAKTQINSLNTEVTTTTSKLKATEINLTNANTKITELTTSSKDLEIKASLYKEQLDRLQNNYTELQKIKASDVIGSLPGGTVINHPDGSQTVVIEKVVVK
jgi:hypothetical protein